MTSSVTGSVAAGEPSSTAVASSTASASASSGPAPPGSSVAGRTGETVLMEVVLLSDVHGETGSLLCCWDAQAFQPA